MDVMATTTNTTTTISDVDPPQPDVEDPTRIQRAKPISFSNGKSCHHFYRHPAEAVATYKECLKNHAAGIGGHALDGCGEFMPSPSSNSDDPTSLTCAACGCHRNFHRREGDPPSLSAVVPTIEYRPLNRHQLPPPSRIPPVRARGLDDDDDSASPPPISSSYMLLALSGRGGTVVPRKRFRTKFSQFQKEKMFEFAERVSWKMPKMDDVAVREFCREIGVDKSVFKVWMHNNKVSRRVGGARRVNGGGGDSCESVPTNGSFSST